ALDVAELEGALADALECVEYEQGHRQLLSGLDIRLRLPHARSPFSVTSRGPPRRHSLPIILPEEVSCQCDDMRKLHKSLVAERDVAAYSSCRFCIPPRMTHLPSI